MCITNDLRLAIRLFIIDDLAAARQPPRAGIRESCPAARSARSAVPPAQGGARRAGRHGGLPVALSMFHDFEEFRRLTPSEPQAAALDRMLDELIAWGAALKQVRDAGAQTA
jgi:hypothetical protein